MRSGVQLIKCETLKSHHKFSCRTTYNSWSEEIDTQIAHIKIDDQQIDWISEKKDWENDSERWDWKTWRERSSEYKETTGMEKQWFTSYVKPEISKYNLTHML